MSATIRDAFAELLEKTQRIESPPAELADPTEDLANEVTTELNPAPLRSRPPVRPPIGLGIAEIEPIGRTPPLTAGAVLRDRYVLERQIANGGTAMIFRAHDLRRDASGPGGPRVAVKLLHPELRSRPQHVARLQREFRQTQALPHSNIVRVHDLDCDHGVWFIVMELLAGETLGPRLRRRAPDGVPLAEGLPIISAAAEALAFAHERGVVHGDIKPDNIFVMSTGAVRVLDFGVAPQEPARSGGGTPAGEAVVAAATRAYASPQVLAGERPQPSDDVFSLACVLYEMAAGHHPWGRRGADEAERSGTKVELPPSLSAVQCAVLQSALSWNRQERPGVRELVVSLRDALQAPGAVPATERATVPTPPYQPAAPEPSARQPGRWQLGAAAIAAFLVGLAFSLLGGEPPDSPPEEVRPAPASPASPPYEVVVSEPLTRGPAAIDVAAPREELTSPVASPNAATTTPGFVAFESESMTVSSRAVVAAIPVRHFAGDRRGVEVGWRVLEGSAVAGRDIGGPLSGVARFAEGHTYRMIFVPITVDPGAVGERTFAVELRSSPPGVALGTMHRILVTILDDA